MPSASGGRTSTGWRWPAPTGVAEVLRNIRAELDLTMALTGCRTLADITRDRLVEAPLPH